jgi:hypothetical protein
MLLPLAATADNSPWHERVDFSADLRLRYEAIREDQSADRDRGRFRGRFEVKAAAADDISLVLRLATGDGNPRSTNVTFGEGFSAKDIRIDRAYVNWHINDQWQFYGGKIKSPWFRAGGSALLWDSDLNPEGVAALFTSGLFFGSLSALQIEERSSSDNSLLLTFQGGVKLDMADAGSVSAAPRAGRTVDQPRCLQGVRLAPVPMNKGRQELM